MCHVVSTPHFKIKSLGVKDIDVYDIEVKDNHNFFGNNICLHNSSYFLLQGIVDKAKKSNPSALSEDKNIVEFLDRFVKSKIQNKINESTADIVRLFNGFQNALGAKREAIASAGIWTGKKKYALDVWDFENIRYESPEVKVTGIETQRSSTPDVVKTALLESIELILRTDVNELRSYVEAFKDKFIKMEPELTAGITSVNDIELQSNAEGEPIKGSTFQVKAALVYNKFVHAKDDKEYEKIYSGDKIKVMMLKQPNPYWNSKCIGFIEKFPYEYIDGKYIDYDAQFFKTYLKPLENITKRLNWELEKSITLEHLFG